MIVYERFSLFLSVIRIAGQKTGVPEQQGAEWLEATNATAAFSIIYCFIYSVNTTFVNVT